MLYPIHVVAIAGGVSADISLNASRFFSLHQRRPKNRYRSSRTRSPTSSLSCGESPRRRKVTSLGLVRSADPPLTIRGRARSRAWNLCCAFSRNYATMPVQLVQCQLCCCRLLGRAPSGITSELVRRYEHLGTIVLDGVSRAASFLLLIDTVMRLPLLLRGAWNGMGLTLESSLVTYVSIFSAFEQFACFARCSDIATDQR